MRWAEIRKMVRECSKLLPSPEAFREKLKKRRRNRDGFLPLGQFEFRWSHGGIVFRRVTPSRAAKRPRPRDVTRLHFFPDHETFHQLVLSDPQQLCSQIVRRGRLEVRRHIYGSPPVVTMGKNGDAASVVRRSQLVAFVRTVRRVARERPR